MNYQQIESLFRQEQLELDQSLRLNLAAVDLRRLQRDWKSVRSTNTVHRVGGLFGMIYVVLASILAYTNWQDQMISLPLVAGAVALLINGFLFPVQTVPTINLERFSVAELADKLRDFQRYAMRRFPFDVAAVVIFLLALFNWTLRLHYGIDPFLPINDGLAWRVWPIIGALTVVPMLLAWRMNEKSVRELRELEERLRGYEAEEYV
ncbi:MAG: hypothetical protein AB8H12_13650 [Lewinella sp.]